MTPQLQATLEHISAVKADIYTAITSKGGNLDGVPFEQWGSVIAGLQFGVPTPAPPVETTTPVEDVVQVGSDVAAALPLAGYPVPPVPDMVPAGMFITSASAWYWPFDFTGEDADSGIPEPRDLLDLIYEQPVVYTMVAKNHNPDTRTFIQEFRIRRPFNGAQWFHVTTSEPSVLLDLYNGPTDTLVRSVPARSGSSVPTNYMVKFEDFPFPEYIVLKVAFAQATTFTTTLDCYIEPEVVAPPVVEPTPEPETPINTDTGGGGGNQPTVKQWYGAGGGPFADTSQCFAAAKADFLSANPDFLSDSIREKFGTGWDRSSDSFTMVVEGRVSMSLEYWSQSYQFTRS